MLRAKRKIVISVHGIWTTGAWQKQLASVISERGWIYYPLDYGYFTPLRFAIPSLRHKNVNWFREEFNHIKQRYPDVFPSVIAHSNGTYIVAQALLKFPEIRLDKVILSGSIVRQNFPWKIIFERNQATLVRNEIGRRDLWSKFVRLLAPLDTGPSGQQGFKTEHERLREENFSEYEHSSFQSYGHYEKFWLPLLDEEKAFVNETQPPRTAEEPVSPYDAARWSATTYFRQYVARVHNGMSRGEIIASASGQKISAKQLRVLIPKTPGRAAENMINAYFEKCGWAEAKTRDGRTVRFDQNGTLYDIPSVLNTLGFLDHRKDEELTDAVREFADWLRRLVNDPASEYSDTVVVEPIPVENNPSPRP